jgi:hypothetical protein
VDESLGDFARRRLGAEALEKLLDPMVTGIFAGDPDTMSLRSCFPLIHELEQKYGGLVKGMISLQRERRKAGEKREMSAGPGGILMSFDAGVQTLIDVLASLLSEGLHTGIAVESVRQRGGRFLLSLVENGRRGEIDTDALVLATPAYSAASALRSSTRGFRSPLGHPVLPDLRRRAGIRQATIGNPWTVRLPHPPPGENGRSWAPVGLQRVPQPGARGQSPDPPWSAEYAIPTLRRRRGPLIALAREDLTRR